MSQAVAAVLRVVAPTSPESPETSQGSEKSPQRFEPAMPNYTARGRTTVATGVNGANFVVVADGPSSRRIGPACCRMLSLRVARYCAWLKNSQAIRLNSNSLRLLFGRRCCMRLASHCQFRLDSKPQGRGSESALTCPIGDVLAATKLLHAISPKRKLLTSQLKARSSLQSIMGATLTRRSNKFIFHRFLATVGPVNHIADEDVERCSRAAGLQIRVPPLDRLRERIDPLDGGLQL